MKSIFLTPFIFCSLIFTGNIFSQTLNSFYQNITNEISLDSINNYLTKIQCLGVKSTPSTNLTNAALWLKNKYISYGYTDVKLDSFVVQNSNLCNVVVTKTGTTHPEKILIIDGHYDSTVGSGVNDNGSGVSIILEIARLLKNINTEYTIKFINFTGEEQGYWGSINYVNNRVIGQNMNILLVLNIDEVGGVSGMTNNTIICEKDLSQPLANNAASSAYTDTLANIVSLYSSLIAEFGSVYGSDYVPFQEAGVVVTGLFEKNESPHVHSSNDIISNLDVDYVYQVAKATTGAALYFSRAKSNTFQISGNIVYNNSNNTVLNAVSVFLMKGTLAVSNTTTDSFGNYLFSNIANDTYTITGTTSRILGGVNATDVLKIKRHIASLELITEPIRLTAADVNLSGSINATDVLKIQRRIASLDTSFSSPDWIFEKPFTGGNSVSVNGTNVIQNFYGLCAGDVNGSNTPAK